MNINEIICLGIDGNIYSVKRYAELEYDDNGFPVKYLVPKLPSVPLIAKAFSARELEEHPIRKARFKYLAAKEHNIVEKQRPQDVTLEEARNMVRQWLHDYGQRFDWAGIIADYWMF